MQMRGFVAGFACALVAAAFALGPLNPPAGPVSPTAKPLGEIEPRTAINATNTPGDADSLFKITQPGSYYLTGNITGVAGKHGIEIVSSGVTIDLNGFDLVGVAGMGAFDGVSATAAGLRNITVLNGSVRNWGDEGVDLATAATSNGRVERVFASGNAGLGIFVGTGSTVTDCAANQNAVIGISAGAGSSISGCASFQNTGGGISTGNGCSVSHCTANQNSSAGFSTGGGCALADCSAFQNTGTGFGTGIGCSISNCAANNNATGINASSACTISTCSAVNNSGTGISVGSGSEVVGCTARDNNLDGIQCLADCLIRGNSCTFNGSGAGDGAGIHATGADNRIEGNSCSSADRGIDVDLAGNIITRNTCSGNTTNWDVVAGNVCLVVQGVAGGAAILGNTGGVAPGSTDPNANFTY